MPVCYVTLSESVSMPSTAEIDIIRDIVAEGLNSKSRFLDRNHIVIRVQHAQRSFMLGEIEIELFAQLYLRRFFSRDKRAKFISQKVSELLKKDCATWINMGMQGYSRVTTDGHTYFSD
jgi:hypothetical protein